MALLIDYVKKNQPSKIISNPVGGYVSEGIKSGRLVVDSAGVIRSMGKGSRYNRGGYASGQSPAEIQAAREKVLAEEKARKEAFSKTGGLVAPGQMSSYFTVSSNDIQTDSQAIKTATQAADNITKTNKGTTATISAYTPREKNFLETSAESTIDFLGLSPNPEVMTVEYTKSGSQYGGKLVSIPISGDEYNSLTVSAKAALLKKYSPGEEYSVRQLKGGQAVYGAIETSPFFGTAIITGATLGFGSALGPVVRGVGGVISKAAAPVVQPVTKFIAPATKVVASVSEPISVAASKSIAAASEEVFNLLTPSAQKVVSEVGKKEITKKAIETGGVVIKTEVTGEALRQTGTYTPEIAEGVYLTATPNRLFQPTKETDIAAQQTYTAARVAYYGGERQTVDEAGVVVKTEKVPGAAPPWESYAEQFVPGIKVATGFAPTFEEKTPEKIKDIPEYKALKTDAERKQYEKEYKDYYLNVGQIGGTVGQVFIETGGEVTGGGRLKGLEFGGIKTRAGGIGRFVIASGSTGIQEGISSAELSAKVEQRTLTDQERTNAAIMGGGIAGAFGGAQAATMGTKYNRIVNITGELSDFPGEPLGDVLGGGVKKALNVPDIKVGSGLVKTSYGPSITSTTDITKGTKGTKKQSTKPTPLQQQAMDFFFTDQTLTKQERINKGLGLKSNVNLPGGITDTTKPETKPDDRKPEPPGPIIPEPSPEPEPEPEPVKEKEQQNVPTNVPSWVNVPSTVPVIAPQGFFFPGFFPVGEGGNAGVRERTKIYDELSAAGKRFTQLSGLPFTQQTKAKRPKSVLINGKEFRIGKRVKKK